MLKLTECGHESLTVKAHRARCPRKGGRQTVPEFRRKWKGSLQWEAEYDPFSKGQAEFK